VIRTGGLIQVPVRHDKSIEFKYSGNRIRVSVLLHSLFGSLKMLTSRFVVIRNLTPNDLEEFCRVRLNALQQYPVAYSMMPELFKEAPIEAKLSQLRDSESDTSNFIKGYFDNGKLIGIIGFLVSTRASVAHKGTMWGFYVDPEYQSKGIGRRLLCAYLDEVNKDQSIVVHRLMTPVNGENAIKLFESVGYIKYGQEPDGISDGEKLYDQCYYYLSCPEHTQEE
jgi:ribosomal protein S18 acetylase RimI-like enzyme